MAFSELVKISANRSSFHALRNASAPVATNPGSDSGRITEKSARSREQPSTRAASSISVGRVAK